MDRVSSAQARVGSDDAIIFAVQSQSGPDRVRNLRPPSLLCARGGERGRDVARTLRCQCMGTTSSFVLWAHTQRA